MCDNAMKLTLNSDTFKGMKDDFDTILARILADMNKRNVDEATITMKLSISLDRETLPPQTSEDDPKELVIPTFKHDISSVMQVKDKKTGSISGHYELVYDETTSTFVMKHIGDGQVNMDDVFSENDSGDDGCEITAKPLPAPEESSCDYDDCEFTELEDFVEEDDSIEEAEFSELEEEGEEYVEEGEEDEEYVEEDEE